MTDDLKHRSTHFLRKRVYYLLILILAFLFLSFDQEETTYEQNNGYIWEEYDPRLFTRLQSIDDVLAYADSVTGNGNRQAQAYSEVLASVVRKRFYHGYSYYSFKDNWVAWLAGNLIWDHLHALVLPDDIMKRPMAACSQQGIILRECFERVGIDYREVALKGHYVLEGKVEGRWLLFDTNIEPQFVKGRKSLDELMRSGELSLAYQQKLTPEQYKEIFGHPIYKKVNAPIAPNATLFQRTTKVLSFGLPLALLILFPYFWFRRKQLKNKIASVRFLKTEKASEKEIA